VIGLDVATDRKSIVRIGLGELLVGEPNRRRGVNKAHVDALTRLEGNWPPILVHEESHQVIDGVHRVLAAQALGMTCLACEIFTGNRNDAYVEFLRRNVRNGLPLTLSERRWGAQRVLREHPEWSDRRVGDICALAAVTVARLRADLPGLVADRLTVQFEQLDARVGRDGKSRPVDRRALRGRILEVEEANPGASLRTVAAKAGASPETVRRIRKSLACVRGDRRDDEFGVGTGSQSVAALDWAKASGVDRWATDRAFNSTTGTTAFAAWFDRSFIDGGWKDYVDAVPLGRIYEVADECRRRAKSWQEFSVALENRARSSARAV
jgi:ParB-like chromosome segregation protein Spo0J